MRDLLVMADFPVLEVTKVPSSLLELVEVPFVTAPLEMAAAAYLTYSVVVNPFQVVGKAYHLVYQAMVVVPFAAVPLVIQVMVELQRQPQEVAEVNQVDCFSLVFQKIRKKNSRNRKNHQNNRIHLVFSKFLIYELLSLMTLVLKVILIDQEQVEILIHFDSKNFQAVMLVVAVLMTKNHNFLAEEAILPSNLLVKAALAENHR